MQLCTKLKIFVHGIHGRNDIHELTKEVYHDLVMIFNTCGSVSSMMIFIADGVINSYSVWLSGWLCIQLLKWHFLPL